MKLSASDIHVHMAREFIAIDIAAASLETAAFPGNAGDGELVLEVSE
jgi:hypothetical protein